MGRKARRVVVPPVTDINGELAPVKLQFLDSYIKTGSITTAAKLVGVTTVQGRRWLAGKKVQAHLEKVRTEISAKIGYSLETAMVEAEQAKRFAEKTNNANAYVKAVDLKAKLNGLLVEKHQHLTASFSIQVEGVRGEQLTAGARGAIPPPQVPQSEDEITVEAEKD